MTLEALNLVLARLRRGDITVAQARRVVAEWLENS